MLLSAYVCVVTEIDKCYMFLSFTLGIDKKVFFKILVF